MREFPFDIPTWSCLFIALTVPSSAVAQEAPKAPVTPPTGESAVAPEVEYEGSNAGLADEFPFPDPNRPWGRPRYLDRDRLGWTAYPRTYSGSRRYYYDNFTYRFGVPYDDWRYDDLERAYRQGVEDGRNFERFEIQAERGVGSYQRAIAEGHTAFAAGRYADAARDFLLAARLNQGDPTSRLCGAHALIALGHYEQAAPLLRRAFDLQPRIAYLPLDVRTAYDRPADFQRHLDALCEASTGEPDNAELGSLLGYLYLFSERPEKALGILARGAELEPDDRLIRTLLGVARARNPAQSAPKTTKQQSKPGGI